MVCSSDNHGFRDVGGGSPRCCNSHPASETKLRSPGARATHTGHDSLRDSGDLRISEGRVISESGTAVALCGDRSFFPSFVPDVLLAKSHTFGGGWPESCALMVMHVIVWIVCIFLLPALAFTSSGILDSEDASGGRCE